MKKLNLKQPKYIFPLVVFLPLTFLAYEVSSMFDGNSTTSAKVATDSLNMELPDADNQGMKDKMASMGDRGMGEDGYSAIDGLGNEEAAKDHSDLNYVLIDDVIKDKKNVASVTFADNESGYLAGVAAAKTTKTKQVGFVGGQESEVISRFEAGFKAGVASVDPSIKVQVDYAGSFGDAAKGKTIAAAQYAAGADIVYQVAGGTGAGVFAEAKSLNESRPENEKVWVIGVDRDQEAEGKYTSKDGKESNFVLVSTLKQVGTTVKDISNKAEKGEFPGGQVIVYSLKDKGVDLAVTNLSEEGKKAVEAAKAKILDGSVKVPEK